MDSKLFRQVILVSVVIGVNGGHGNEEHEGSSSSNRAVQYMNLAPSTVVRFTTESKPLICSGAVVNKVPVPVVLTTDTCWKLIKDKKHVKAKTNAGEYAVPEHAHAESIGNEQLMLIEMSGTPESSFKIAFVSEVSGPFGGAKVAKWEQDSQNKWNAYAVLLGGASLGPYTDDEEMLLFDEGGAFEQGDSGAPAYMSTGESGHKLIAVRVSLNSYVNVAQFYGQITRGIKKIQN